MKTNKEYQAHLYEIEQARKKKDSIEESLLEVMGRVEENDKAAKELEELASEAQKVFDVEKVRLETFSTELVNELTDLEQQQNTVADTVEKLLLARYNRLKTMQKGPLEGCQMGLPGKPIKNPKGIKPLCRYGAQKNTGKV